MKKHGKTPSGKRRSGTPTWNEAQLHLLMQAVQNCSDQIGMVDLDGNVTFANHAFLDAVGYTKEEFMGKHFGITIASTNAPSLVQEIAEKGLRDSGWRGECISVRRDGSTYPIFLNVGPVKDDHGRAIGSFGIARDITQRKLADKALRESEEQFRQLAENIREVFFVMQTDTGKVTYVSPAYDEIWGRPRKEVLERPTAWIDSIHPQDRERVGRAFEMQMSQENTSMEYRIVRPDGSVRWISNRTFSVTDANGAVRRVVGIAEDITSRHQEQAALREAHEKLGSALSDAMAHAKETAKLTELVDILQSCQTVNEAYKITGDAVPTIVASPAGALCITSSSRNIVEAVVTWGDGTAIERTFAPDSCWGLRRGKIHTVDSSTSPMRCKHVDPASGSGYVCVPLAAQGETLGVLCLLSPPPAKASQNEIDEQREVLKRQGGAVGERISLALANLRLREVLRTQSIRDPLTGLFNRRYMEESLERELRRAARNQQTVALLMLDIDHFKRFNDTFGHQAGDTLLRSLGDFLCQRTRGQDVACRFGGEEFALILAGATSEDAVKRSELLREELQQLSVSHAGQILGRITFSIGVAAYPINAVSAEQLIRAADDALYRAKAEGRDRIRVATNSPESHEHTYVTS
jgi:diguanylate cyclase (GGDEF)-like protein/PAS domain S-box-containing protein